MRTLLIGFAAVLAVGCRDGGGSAAGDTGGSGAASRSAASTPTSRGAASRPGVTREGWLPATAYHLSGDGVHAGPALEVDDLLAALTTNANKELRVAGPIHSVAPDRSWLRIGSAAANLYVQCQAGELALPEDAVGRRAICEGRLEVALSGPAAGGGDAGEQAVSKQVASLKATGLAVER